LHCAFVTAEGFGGSELENLSASFGSVIRVKDTKKDSTGDGGRAEDLELF